MSGIVDNNVKVEVQQLWELVFQCGEIVVGHWKKFGFDLMHLPDPNIHDLLLYVTLIEGVVDATMRVTGSTAEELRLLYNTKHRLSLIKLAGKTLDQGDRAAFDLTMEDLKRQVPF